MARIRCSIVDVRPETVLEKKRSLAYLLLHYIMVRTIAPSSGSIAN
ncbi:MAG: hypothetical protein WCD53_11255 [Microcoleus sp.]